jgi:hypothetical protein
MLATQRDVRAREAELLSILENHQEAAKDAAAPGWPQRCQARDAAHADLLRFAAEFGPVLRSLPD